MIAAWWSWMAPMTVQIVAVVAVVSVLERLLARRLRPGLATLLWTAALVKLALPPSLGSPLTVARFESPSIPDWAAAAFWTWVAGVALLSALALRRHARIRRDIRFRSIPVPTELIAAAARQLGLRSAPRAAVLPGLTMPCVFGAFRPIVLLPEGPVDPHALLHEVAHVRRRDPLAGLITLAAQILYWFHPAAWIIRSRLATLREIGCDARAAQVAGLAEYRRMLLEVARRVLGPAPGATALAFGRSRLVERLEWLTPARGSRFGRIFAPAAAAVALAACVPFARPAVVALALPSLSEVQGCMQKQLLVISALAQEASKENRP